MGREITAADFEQLYRATAPDLFAYVRRRTPADAEDLVAEVFAIAWRRRGDLPGRLLRRAWLFGTARTLLLADARARGQADQVVEALARAVDTSTAFADNDREHVVARALDRLRPDERELIQLLEWERMTPAEVAVVLGIRPGTARVRIHRARLSLATDPELRELVRERASARSR
ncbi:MAG TPA: sigma-70 family RNA polymerase sigma factor [Marmoricola sp.]